MLADAFLRIAGAIVLEILAFAVWNVGARSPVEVARAAVRSLRNPRALFTGIVALAIGVVFIVAATVLLQPAFVDPMRDFMPIELVTFLIALAIDQTIGNDLRTLAGARTSGDSD